MPTSDHGWASDWYCLRDGLVHGALVVAAAGLVARDGRQLRLRAQAAATTGLLVVQVKCPYNARIHLLLGHATRAPTALLMVIVARRLVHDLV